MKKFLVAILLIAGAVAWQAHTKQAAKQAALETAAALDAPRESAPASESPLERAEAAPRLPLSPAAAETSFSCDGRKYCSQMRSCAEATYFLRNCPDTKLDGDHDGIPCEQQHCNGSFSG